MINTVKTISVILLRRTNISYCDVLKTRKKIHNISDIPRVTLHDIKKLLKQKGYAVQDGTTSITTKCCICCNENKKPDNKIFVNKMTGYFLCPHCSTHGDWNILERLLRKPKGDSATKDLIDKCQAEEKKFQYDWKKIVNDTTSLCNLSDVELQELLKLYEYPVNLEAAKVLSDVRVNNNRTILYLPLVNSLNQVVGYKKIQAGQEDNIESIGLHSAGIFICKVSGKASKQDQAVLVPKIEDIISLAAHKVPGTYVWLSVCTLPLAMLPALENYSKLYLWGDWSNMLSVSEKLGNQRCHFVSHNHSTKFPKSEILLERPLNPFPTAEKIYITFRPTDGLVTATEAAQAGMSLKALVADAKPAAHRSITTFAALRDDVYAELSNIEKTRGVKWRRFPALNKLLGGHRRGELTVLTGPTGCGKTTLCAEMSLDLAQQGVNTLWGSFEIRNSRLARTMLQQSAGVSLEQNLQDFNKYADEFQKLPIYYLAFHGPQPLKIVMEAVEHARYVHDLCHVVVDNVQFMLGVGEDNSDRFWRQDAVVAAFRGFATARHCHVTLVMHPRKERDADDLSTSSIFGSAKASQEADNVLIIQDKRLTAVRGKKYLQIAKNRYSGDLGIVPLDFDKEALSYQNKKKAKTNKTPEDTKIQDTENTDQVDLTDNDYIEKDINLYDEDKHIPTKTGFYHPYDVVNTNKNG